MSEELIKATSEVLTAEQVKLHTLISQIEQGHAEEQRGRMVKAQALAVIHKERLYLSEGHSTLEEFCQKQFGWARRTIYDYLKAAGVAENVWLTTQTPPSLTQAVQLAALPPDQQREVAADIDFKTATVAEVKAAVKHKQAIPKGLRTDLGPKGVQWPNPDGSVDEDPAIYKRKPVEVVINEEDRWDLVFRALEEASTIMPRAGNRQESMRRWSVNQLASRLAVAKKVDASLKTWIKLMESGK